MAISFNGFTINLDLDTILIWCLVGLLSGFLASILHINAQVIGHPIIS